MVEHRLSNQFDVRLKGEDKVQDDTQVVDFRGWRDVTAIHLEKKMSDLQKSRLGTYNHELWFFAIEFEEVDGHPDLYFMKTVDYGLWGEQSGWCGAEIQLCIIST